jgi:hypothetical protein
MDMALFSPPGRLKGIVQKMEERARARTSDRIPERLYTVIAGSG